MLHLSHIDRLAADCGVELSERVVGGAVGSGSAQQRLAVDGRQHTNLGTHTMTPGLIVSQLEGLGYIVNTTI